MKKVLLMGGSYFIGKSIVESLLEADYEVYILNRGTKKINDDRINQIICDRNNIDEMSIKLKDYLFDIVIDISGLNEEQTNILYISLNLVSIKQFVFISSSSVYDVENLNAPFLETDTLSQNKYWTDYGLNKIKSEQYYIDKFNNTDTKLVILRPPYVYGENNYAQRESFIFNNITNNKPIIIPNSNFKLQFIYAKDLANIIITLLNKSLNNISIFNVGNKQAVTVREWIETCFKIAQKSTEIINFNYNKSNYQIRDFFPFYDYDNVLDVDKINKIYSEETPFEVGLKASYNWYLDNKDKIEFKKYVSDNEKKILKILNI